VPAQEREQRLDARVQLARAGIGLEGDVGQVIALDIAQKLPARLTAESRAKTARIFEGALRPGESPIRRQQREDAVLRRPAEGQVARRGAFVAAGDHAAGVK